MSDFKLDFLCVGFNKCGTSSLHSVLKQIPEIQLPYGKKETLFFSWSKNYDDPLDMFQKRYFPTWPYDSPAPIRGAVEASFMKHADDVFRYFGPDVKLIFMLRNPVDAIWSLFKMRLRRIKGPQYSRLYLREDGDIDRMFRRFLKEFVNLEKDSDFFYDYWLWSFQNYYPREQMKLILFEDYVQHYEEQMAELGQFLGFSADSLPLCAKQNVGDRISRNYFCAEINRMCLRHSKYVRKSGTNQEVYFNECVMPVFYRYTLMDCPVLPSEQSRQLAKEIFLGSVRRTDLLTGLSLEERWFGGT